MSHGYRVLIGGLVLTGVTWLVLAVLGVAKNQSSHAGPMEASDGKQTYVVKAEAGQVFTDGFSVFFTRGMARPTILRIESIGGDDVLEFLGAKLALPEPGFVSTQQSQGFPPIDVKNASIFDAVGYQALPGPETYNESGYQLLLGYRVRKSAYAARTGVRFTYKVGDETFESTLNDGLALCPPSMDEDLCLDLALAEIPDRNR